MGKKKSSTSKKAGTPAMASISAAAATPPVTGAGAPNVNATTCGTPRVETASSSPQQDNRAAMAAAAKTGQSGQGKSLRVEIQAGGQRIQAGGQQAGSQQNEVNSGLGQDNVVQPVGGKNSNMDKGDLVNTWANLFKHNRSPATGAALTQIIEGVEMEGIHFDIDEIEEDSQVSRSLIGFFSPKFPGMEAVKQLTQDWKHKCQIFRHASTWTVFTFSSKEEALGVLEAGPYHIFGSVLHLRTMPKFFNFSREAQQYMPVWIQLHNLPLEFWKPRLLSKICTFIGQPLHTDQLTKTRERISFARCLVQVDVNLNLPTILTLHLPGGTVLEQPVLYENRPLCCTNCKRIGHEASACKDTGIPKLYVMKKPMKKVEKVRKINPVSAPVDTWVQVGKTVEENTIIDTQVDNPEAAQEEVGSEDDGSDETEEEGNEENATEDEDNEDNSEEDSDDGEPEEEAEDREPPVVGVLKATASTPTSSPSSTAPSPHPLILKGDRSPPREPPPGYDIQVDEHGGWELFPIWPSVQDAASLSRVTRSRMKK